MVDIRPNAPHRDRGSGRIERGFSERHGHPPLNDLAARRLHVTPDVRRANRVKNCEVAFSFRAPPRRARIWAGLPFGLALIALVTWSAAIIGQERDFEIALAVCVLVATAVVRASLRPWSWMGAQLFAGVALASLAYLLYAASITYAVASDPVYLVASTLLLLLELAALALSVSYLFEIVDTLSRTSEPAHPVDSAYLPKVAIQVPAYNEPLEVVGETLKALAELDYPDLIVQVVDNNTPDREIWGALKAQCEQLGPRFQFMHLENWPGFKAGALNEATRRLPDDIEIIGVVDSDYVVKPDWLRSVVGHFADPKVAFVQTPQNYRDWTDDQYLRGLYFSYEYFFEITMPCRAHRNAIIFAGTMGLIRRSALEEIGGWNPDVVTEDAEASLRILARGHAGVYVPRAYGQGLMPLSFDGLKKQRFRWALGGVQILRLHWRRLLQPGHGERLTVAQRIHYLLGNVQWFGDVLMFCFTLLLLATALSTAMHHQLPIRARRDRGPPGVVCAELGRHPRMSPRPGPLPHRFPPHAEVQGERGVGHQSLPGGADGDASRRGRYRRCFGDAGQGAVGAHDRSGSPAPLSGGHLRQRDVGGRRGRGHPPHTAAPRLQEFGAEHRGAARTGVRNARGSRGGRPCRAGRDAADLDGGSAARARTSNAGPGGAARTGGAPVAVGIAQRIAVGLFVAIRNAIFVAVRVTITLRVSQTVRPPAVCILRRR
ncbi:MAG: glycosyltransferase [Chloroflexi bacterium]|nr:MAG: glycosyltransferase [Chloroflexota bacterium]